MYVYSCNYAYWKTAKQDIVNNGSENNVINVLHITNVQK